MADDKKLTRPTDVDGCMAALIAPFPPESIGWKPGGKLNGSPGKVRVMAYIDARDVQDRLDAVFGADRWYARYVPVGAGEHAQAECQLHVKFPGASEWIMKCDVGSRSDQPDKEDQIKAMYSDSLKRAAVQFGIGRYLYRLERFQAEHDGKQITAYPQLPDWALPEPYRSAGPSLADQLSKVIVLGCKVTGSNSEKSTADFLANYGYPANTPLAQVDRRHVRAFMARVQAAIDNAPLPKDYPQTGPELSARLSSHDTKLAAVGRCEPGELVAHVTRTGVKAGYAADLTTWNTVAIRAAVEWAKSFDSDHPTKKKAESSPAKPADAKYDAPVPY